jgi:hypothetical protein
MDCTIIYKDNTLKYYKYEYNILKYYTVQFNKSQIQIEHGPVPAIKKLRRDALTIFIIVLFQNLLLFSMLLVCSLFINVCCALTFPSWS